MISLDRITRLPVLATLLCALTLAAMGPAAAVDRQLHGVRMAGRDPREYELLHALDNVAGQVVALPVLLGVAVWACRRQRSLHPLRLVVWAELLFYAGVGSLKTLLARSSPTIGDPGFFTGGLLVNGAHGVSYPSGHTAAAVLFYGTGVLLVHRTVVLPRWGQAALVAGWLALVGTTTTVAQLLGYHWVLDLAAGVVVGGVLLRLVLWGDRWWHSPGRRVVQRLLRATWRRVGPAPWGVRRPAAAQAGCWPKASGSRLTRYVAQFSFSTEPSSRRVMRSSSPRSRPETVR